MKTIQELNSKWYWRLVKVIYVILMGIIFIASTVAIFYEFHTYNPNKIESIISVITVKEDGINGKVEKLKSTFPNEHYTMSGVKDIIKNTKGQDGFLNFGDKGALYMAIYLLSSFGKTIDNIETCSYENCESSKETVYNILYTQKDTDTLFLNEEYIIATSKYIEDTKNDYKEMKKELSKCLNKIADYCYISNEDDFEKKYNIDFDKGYSNEYLSILGWTKVMVSVVGVVLLIVISTFIFRGIIYYIILGKFNPEK